MVVVPDRLRRTVRFRLPESWLVIERAEWYVAHVDAMLHATALCSDKILVGSHSGILRVYNPSGSEADAGGSAADLLLETNLGSPIVHIEIGKFVRCEFARTSRTRLDRGFSRSSTSSVNQIAVLFSQKLAVYDYHGESA